MTKPESFDEWLAWARKEREQRISELNSVANDQELKAVQRDMAERRESVGLSFEQASNAIRAVDAVDNGKQWMAEELINWAKNV